MQFRRTYFYRFKLYDNVRQVSANLVLQLYNEQLIDLLSENQKTVDLRESNHGILIPGLTQHSAYTADDILNCLQKVILLCALKNDVHIVLIQLKL